MNLIHFIPEKEHKVKPSLCHEFCCRLLLAERRESKLLLGDEFKQSRGSLLRPPYCSCDGRDDLLRFAHSFAIATKCTSKLCILPRNICAAVLFRRHLHDWQF